MTNYYNKKRCVLCGYLKNSQAFSDKSIQITHKCVECDKQEKEAYNVLTKPRTLEELQQYRADTRIEEIEGKTYLIIPSRINYENQEIPTQNNI